MSLLAPLTLYKRAMNSLVYSARLPGDVILDGKTKMSELEKSVKTPSACILDERIQDGEDSRDGAGEISLFSLVSETLLCLDLCVDLLSTIKGFLLLILEVGPGLRAEALHTVH